MSRYLGVHNTIANCSVSATLPATAPPLRPCCNAKSRCGACHRALHAQPLGEVNGVVVSVPVKMPRLPRNVANSRGV